MPDPLLYEKRGHIAYLTLNRPDQRNAINPEMMVRLAEAWRDFDADGDLRVAILTGAGAQAFCAGADLKRTITLMTGARQPEDEWDQRLRGDPSIGRTALLRDPMYKPVIAAINGHCIAAGTELVQGTDIRVASTDATIGLAEVKRGIVPAGGGMVRMPRQVPFAYAMELMLVGDSVPAGEALRMGLINAVVPPSELMAKAEDYASRIAANGPFAVRKVKEAVLRTSGMTVEEAGAIEGEIVGQVMRSEDAREGPRAFAEGRPPRYTGR